MKYKKNIKKTNSLRKKGILQYHQGKYRNALQYLQQVLDISPDDVEALHYKAHCFQELRIHTEAINTLTKLINVDPNDDHAWQLKGDTYFITKQYEKAVQCYDHAIKINENDDVALANLGFILYDKEKFNEVISYFDRALKIDKKDAYSLHYKGHSLQKLKKFDLALECFTKELQIDSKEAHTWIEKGMCYNELEKYRKAISCFNKALALESNNEDAVANMAISLAHLRKYDEGLNYYKKALLIKNKKSDKSSKLPSEKNLKRKFERGFNKRVPQDKDLSKMVISLERKLRKLIISISSNFDEFWNEIIPLDVQNSIKDNIISKERFQNMIAEKNFKLIDYVDFSDYVKIFINEKNWEKRFRKVFFKKDTFASLTILKNLRNEIQHSRKLDPANKTKFMLHYNDMNKMINNYRREIGKSIKL